MLKPFATAAGRGLWTVLLLCGLLAGPRPAAADDAPAEKPAAGTPAQTDRQKARAEAAAKQAAAKQAKLEARQKAAEAKRKAAEDRAWERRINKLAAQYLKEGAAKARADEAAQKKAEQQQAREKAAAEKAAAQAAKVEAQQRARAEAAAKKAAARTAAAAPLPTTAAEPQALAAALEAAPVAGGAAAMPAPSTAPVAPPTRAEKAALKKAEKQRLHEEAAAHKAAQRAAKLEARQRARDEKAARQAAAAAPRTEAQPVTATFTVPPPPAGPAKNRAKPYVETTPKRGFHLFLRPKKKDAASQWAYVQSLDAANRTRKAAKQALALRIFYANSPEAPQAQLLHARLLERRHHPREAFDAYEFLVEHYPGHFEFNEVIARQMQIAKFMMERKKGKFLFLPGFAAPEEAIPLFEKIVATAPEGAYAAEAYYLIGVANERIYEYEKAIDAYFTTLNRFPQSEFAEKAAFAQAQCHIKISKDSPHDKRALDTAHAACVLYLQRYPDSARQAEIQAELRRLRKLQIENAYALARYYDRILRKPAAALIEYESFIALYPDAEQVPAVRERLAQLKPPQPASEK